MRARADERHDNWLLIKGKDEEARGPRDKDILEEKSRSVATGRSIEEIAAGKGPRSGSGIQTATAPNRKTRRRLNNGSETSRRGRPRDREPRRRRVRGSVAEKQSSEKPRSPDARQIETARRSFRSVSPRFTTNAPSGPDWLHEIKFDGYRMRGAARSRQGAIVDAQAAGLDAPL